MFKKGDKVKLVKDLGGEYNILGHTVDAVLEVEATDPSFITLVLTNGTGKFSRSFVDKSDIIKLVEIGGTKSDTNKLPCDLLSVPAMLGTAAVLAFGAKKYAPNNWRKGLAWMRISAAIMRHLFAFIQGEDLDPETGLPHVDHLGCEAMFLQELYRTRKDLDDRYKPETKKES